MKVKVVDAEELSKPAPANLRRYLAAHGWRETAHLPSGVASVWTTEPEHGLNLLVPTHREYTDYPRRVADVLDTLQRAEGRSQLDILTDLVTALDDSLSLRVVPSAPTDLTITTELGRTIIDQGEMLLGAAALAAREPRAYFKGRWPTEAAEWSRSLRMGQPRLGSFTFVFLHRAWKSQTRLPDFPEGADLSIDAAPYDRRVFGVAMRAIEAARAAATRAVETGSLEAFEEFVPLGVSANLCDSLAGMLSRSLTQRITFSVAWALEMPQLEAPRTVEMTSDFEEALIKGADLLRPKDEPEEQEIEGLVTHLDRDRPDDPEGRVFVEAFVEGGPRRVSIVLPKEQYEEALRSHWKGNRIRCQGVLVRTASRLVLERPHDFVVLR